VSGPSIHVVTPTRGDRDERFLALCRMYASWQTRKPDKHWIIAYPPSTDKPDLVPRVRQGMEAAFADGADIVAIMEDDDYYGRRYLESVMWAWEHSGRPRLIGGSCGVQYHIGSRACGITMHEWPKPSALYMMAFHGMPESWPAEDSTHLDWHFMRSVHEAQYVCFPQWTVVGIKHGSGLCGGRRHFTMGAEEANDPDGELLRDAIGDKLSRLYLSLGDEIRESQARHRLRSQGA